MKILNALQLKNGAKADYTKMIGVTQPLQFIPKKEKDEEWAAWNMDWLEWQGLKQIRANARNLMKNYKLADGIIDKTDYIREDTNDMRDIVDQLADTEPLEVEELKFFPIIPNVVNTLVAEFAKRDKKVSFRAMDEFTHNEILESKKRDLESILVKQAEQQMLLNMVNEGLDINDPEVQKKYKEQISPENIKTLPELEEFYQKNYEVISEKWAMKQYMVDEERFNMEELEETAFRDKIITSREFWHFPMYEDDYGVELWNPVLTFYHKSPKERYISNAQYVGHIEVMTAADIIDNYGWNMTEEQLEYLNEQFFTSTPAYNLGGIQNDGSFYNATKSHDWNVERPSLGYRKLMSGLQSTAKLNDIVGWVLDESEDGFLSNEKNLFRVTTAYWKSQMKVGHLTRIKENGEVVNDIVTEDYKITDKPEYNTSLIPQKTKKNLIFGEHIEWVWINQVWGGIKIGPNAPTMYGTDNATGINPIYLGINSNHIRPLKFQFKGDSTLYGCKLPVEGRVFNDRNTKSTSIVDAMKPFQIGYNIVNNQISDILMSEIGTVILLDQNALPKHSLGEDWGKGNLPKAYLAMKNFNILPLDTTITNTENSLAFQHYQQLDLSQTNRLASRIQLAQFFKQQAFEQVGISQQRMGQPVGQRTTATEIEQISAGAYAQTEMQFIEHSEYLMPRVHQMRTDLSQWYNSTKPSIKLQIITTNDERTNFEINGEELMLRDINVYCTAKANIKDMIEKLKQLAINNNTTGATIFDLAKILQTNSLGDMNSILKGIEAKAEKQRQEEYQHQQQLQQQQLEAQEREKQMEMEHESIENEKKHRKDILVAEIKASGYGAMQDINKNSQSDFIDNLEKIKKTEQYQESINIQKDAQQQRRQDSIDKNSLKREEMASKERMKEMDYAIARENKNKFDFHPYQDKKEKKSKKEE